MRKRKGFTMVELLVVLVIVGILAAVATPLYLANAKRAKASEAIATMSLIRQAEREYYTKHNTYLSVLTTNLPNDPEAATNKGLGIDVGVAQYFSNAAYVVTAGGTSARFADPPAVDFVITANGALTSTCTTGSTANCAVNGDDVKATAGTTYVLEMDNSGRAFVSYNGGGTTGAWSKW